MQDDKGPGFASDPGDLRRRFAQWDKHIQAFVTVAGTDAGIGQKAGPLAGMTVGVKDIIDVAGLPTRCGSATRDTAPPASQDAAVVARLRAAGATIVGKTTSTEFAFTDPTACRNPYDLRRSPGGSSSGSGAAVAAGMVDIALGTQTAGSLCRPAAYCGAVGVKPTANLWPLDGVTPLAPSFDTVGIITRRVGLAQRAFDTLAPSAPYAAPSRIRAVCGLWQTDVTVQDAYAHALHAAQSALCDLGVRPQARRLPADVDAVVGAHRTVMCAEAAAAHGALLMDGSADLLQPGFRAGLRAGLDVTPGMLDTARRFLAHAKQAFWTDLSDIDLVLTLAVPDGAPMLDGTTGYQNWLTPWTVFGGPLVCLPWGLDHLSRPCSVMLAAPPGQDRWLLDFASRLEARAPILPAPRLPTGA